MAISGHAHRVVVTSYLEPDLIHMIREEVPEVELVVPGELIPLPKYPGDHALPRALRPREINEWRRHLGDADVLFDFGPVELQMELLSLPRLRWIQATSAGVGQLVRRLGLDEPGAPVVTTASGVHGPALAEFVCWSVIAFNRDFQGMLSNQSHRRWVRGAGRLVRGQTAVVVGLGSIGREVAIQLGHFGARTIGVVRTVAGRKAEELHVDELYSMDALDGLLGLADVLVLSCPHTTETDRLLDERRLRLLSEDSIVVNISRGGVVDESALIRALADHRIAGAALDVVSVEPLAGDSALWDLPNVIVSPHSAATVEGENLAIVQLFLGNLRRFVEGLKLHGAYEAHRQY